jgi:hypothetical protein
MRTLVSTKTALPAVGVIEVFAAESYRWIGKAAVRKTIAKPLRRR